MYANDVPSENHRPAAMPQQETVYQKKGSKSPLHTVEVVGDQTQKILNIRWPETWLQNDANVTHIYWMCK